MIHPSLRFNKLSQYTVRVRDVMDQRLFDHCDEAQSKDVHLSYHALAARKLCVHYHVIRNTLDLVQHFRGKKTSVGGD